MIGKIFGELFAQQLEELGFTSDKTTFDDIFDDIAAFFEKRFNIAISVAAECSRHYGLADYDMGDWFVVGNIHDIPELIAYGAITEADNDEMNEKYPPRDEDIAFIGNKMG